MPSTTKQIRWLQSFFKIQKYFKSMKTKSYIGQLQNQCDGIKSVGEDLIHQSVIKYSRAKQFIKTSKSAQANRNCSCCFNIFWGFFHKSTMGNWKWTYSIKIVLSQRTLKVCWHEGTILWYSQKSALFNSITWWKKGTNLNEMPAQKTKPNNCKRYKRMSIFILKRRTYICLSKTQKY